MTRRYLMSRLAKGIAFATAWAAFTPKVKAIESPRDCESLPLLIAIEVPGHMTVQQQKDFHGCIKRSVWSQRTRDIPILILTAGATIKAIGGRISEFEVQKGESLFDLKLVPKGDK